jgi:hypothetical protein
MVPEMKIKDSDDQDWKSLFKKKSYYSFQWTDASMTLTSFIQRWGEDICHHKRYSRIGFKADVFELVQVLLWSRISERAYNQLLQCFSGNTESSTVTQRTASDEKGTKMNQWVSGIVDTIGTAVYFMYKVHRGQSKALPEELVVMRLIESAIEQTTVFFTEIGLDPNPPPWFESVKERLKNEELIRRAISETLQDANTMPNGAKKKQTPKQFDYTPLLQNDYMSFIRVAFAVHLQSSILNVTKGNAKLKPCEELGFSSDLDFTSPDSAKMFLLNNTVGGIRSGQSRCSNSSVVSR